jgi:hypothetical protein
MEMVEVQGHRYLNRGWLETSVAISLIREITLQIDTKHTGKKHPVAT